MSQTPVSMKLTVSQKGSIPGRSGVVQVLQTNTATNQSLLTDTSPVYTPFNSARSLISGSTGFPINTNTAVQYMRKPLEMTVLNPASTYVAASPAQSFVPFSGPLMALNPNIMQSISGPGANALAQLGTPNAGGLSGLSNSRKPCNCTKSHCLKLYCECFAQGQLCQNCNCNNCMNNLAYEEERGRAIKMTLERNPTAFHPKIGRGEGERKHTKGCNCKRSGCLKNYCECYEAKISCSDLCRCQGCRNTEDSVERRSLMRLAAMGSLRSRQPASFKKHLIKPHPETLPHVFFTWEVIEALTTCLLAQAEEAERRDLPTPAQERIVLEEFGRILETVIDSAGKAQVRHSTGSIPAPDSDNEQALLQHSVPTYTPTGRTSSAVGAAAARAAAADVLLRNDEDDDDDDDVLLHPLGVDDDDEAEDDDLFGENMDHAPPLPPHHHVSSRHGKRRRSHMTEFLDDPMLSDEEIINTGNSRHQKHRLKHKASVGGYHHSTRHSKRSFSARDHEQYDPDSIV